MLCNNFKEMETLKLKKNRREQAFLSHFGISFIAACREQKTRF